jgi:pilus assembly protein Flp/PilA
MVNTAMQGAAMVARGRGWQRYIGDERGVTALEYALIGSLIFLAIVGAVVGLGSHVSTLYNTIAANL